MFMKARFSLIKFKYKTWHYLGFLHSLVLTLNMYGTTNILKIFCIFIILCYVFSINNITIVRF